MWRTFQQFMAMCVLGAGFIAVEVAQAIEAKYISESHKNLLMVANSTLMNEQKQSSKTLGKRLTQANAPIQVIDIQLNR
ncbi:hypothetical protein, partial [Gloeocapsopsis crepidinum]